MAKMFVMYDTAAVIGDPDDATILITADSEGEAILLAKDFPDGIWYEYDIAPDDNLINGKARWDLPPGNKYRTKFFGA